MAAMEPPNLFYRGSSMHGTFKPGDKLTVEKVPFDRIKKGDLVVFRRNAGKESDFIVHRVVAITAKGLATRGDNCHERDAEPAAPEQIVGRVTRYDRGGKARKAGNGWRGRLRAMRLRARAQAVSAAKRIFARPYRSLRTAGFLARIWRPEIELILFETAQGPLAKYVHGGKTVGAC